MRIRLVSLLVVCTAFASLPAHSVSYGLEGVRHFDHVVVLVLENQNYDTSWGPGSVAHYLNSLRAQGVFADQYFGTGHLSLDNYITLVSGQPWNPVTGSDCLTVSLWICAQAQRLFSNGKHLGDQLDAYGLPWKGYMDGMPSPCFHGSYSPTAISRDPYQGNSNEAPAYNYADRHNPWIYFPNVVGNDARCKAHDVPYTQLAADLAANDLPAFSFITPDTCNDGHDSPCANGKPGGLTTADAWLQQEVPQVLSYLNAHNGILMITFDENEFPDLSLPLGCCHGGLLGLPGFGGKIGLLALGAGLTPGKVVHTKYDHASFLRTVEDSFGIGEYLNNAKMSAPMVDVFGP